MCDCFKTTCKRDFERSATPWVWNVDGEKNNAFSLALLLTHERVEEILMEGTNYNDLPDCHCGVTARCIWQTLGTVANVESLVQVLHLTLGVNALHQQSSIECGKFAKSSFGVIANDKAVCMLEQHLDTHRINYKYGSKFEKYAATIAECRPQLDNEIEEMIEQAAGLRERRVEALHSNDKENEPSHLEVMLPLSCWSTTREKLGHITRNSSCFCTRFRFQELIDVVL